MTDIDDTEFELCEDKLMLVDEIKIAAVIGGVSLTIAQVEAKEGQYKLVRDDE